MNAPRNQCGVTLIELLIGITVLALVLALGLPSFQDMLRNGRVRAATETALLALQQARSEALRRNNDVAFAFTDSNPALIDTVPPIYSPNPTTGNWVIFDINPVTAARTLVDSRLGAEGASGSAPTTAAMTPPAGFVGNASEIIFNGLGQARQLTGGDFSIDISAPGAACAPGGPVRCLRIVVSPTGAARQCDPALNPAGTDPRRCT